MSYRDTFSLYSLSLILLLCPVALLPGDNHTGKVYFEDPVTGTTSMTNGTPKMPNVPMDITPNIPETSSPKSSSSGWGIFGLIANLGRKSAKEIRSERVREAIDRAEAKSMAGIPWTSEDYAATGTADLTKAHTYTGFKKGAVPFPHQPAPTVVSAPPAVVAAPVAAAVVAQVASSVPAPTSLTPQVYIPNTVLPGSGVTCLPPADFDGFGGAVPNYDVIVPKSVGMPPKAPKLPNMESLANKSPFENSGNGGPGGIGNAVQSAGTLLAGAGMLANAAGATSAEAAVAGGAVATSGGGLIGAVANIGAGTALGTAIVAVPLVAACLAPGVAAVAVWEYFEQPEYGWIFAKKYPRWIKDDPTNPIVKPEPTAWDWEARRRFSRYDDGLMEWDNIVHARSKNGGGSSSGNTPKGSNNTPSSPNNPQDPKKPRRTQPLSKTEAYAKIRDRYEHFSENTYRLRDGKKPITTSNGKEIVRVEWDHNHGGEWEAYTDLKGTKHIGALDPETLELYKMGIKGRTGSN